MQIRSRIRSTIGFLVVLSSVVFLLWSVGCSEDKQTQVDELAPTVQILSPIATDFASFGIEDSIFVTLYATDESGIASVDLMCTLHNDSTVVLASNIDELDGADDQYGVWFFTEEFPNGSKGLLWATATDEVGNEGTTDTGVQVTLIIGDDIGPPSPVIVISPYPTAQAIIQTVEFDPTLTTDDISPLNAIQVRWDFEGDGLWDINADFDDPTSSAAKKVYHVYTTPDTVTVTMEAKNAYFAQAAAAFKELEIKPEGGEPNPLADFIAIPAGVYPIGVVDLNDMGSGYNGYFENELTYWSYETSGGDTTGTIGPDTLFVTISNGFNIDVNEVSNKFYFEFLNAATDSGFVAYDPYDEESFVRWEETGEILCELLGSSRIKYLNPVFGFDADQEYEHHPVTGVTYAGAVRYASFYGLRLPTEFEWEVAARGNFITTNEAASVVYAWDPNDTITGAYANFSDSGDPNELLDPTKATVPAGSYNGDFLGGSFPTEDAVGPLPGGGIGTYDQCGNVSEWVRDWYARDTYLDMITSGQTIDPQGPQGGTYRVIRGGNFGDDIDNLRVTKRSALSPHEMTPKVGFRTVHTEY
jgi:formylglycine-generating enzyme required for sulfatase activity